MELMNRYQRTDLMKLMVLSKGCDLFFKEGLEEMGVDEDSYDMEKYYSLDEFASKLSCYEFFETEYVEGRMFVVKINTYLSIHKMMGEDSDFPEEYRIEVMEMDGCLYVSKDNGDKTIGWIDEMSQMGQHEYLHFLFGGVTYETH